MDEKQTHDHVYLNRSSPYRHTMSHIRISEVRGGEKRDIEGCEPGRNGSSETDGPVYR